MKGTSVTHRIVDRRHRAAQLYLQGRTQKEIADEFGVNRSVISRDLDAVRKVWVAETLLDFGEAQARELAKLDNLEATHWDAWERSVGLHVKTRSGTNAQGPFTSTEEEELVGDPRFLDGVHKCIAERCKILGIYEATKISLDWRKAAEEQGINAGDIFEHMVNAYVTIIDQSADGQSDSGSAGGSAEADTADASNAGTDTGDTDL